MTNLTKPGKTLPMWQNMVNVTECDHSNATNVTSETNMASVTSVINITSVANMENVTERDKCKNL